MTIVVDASIAVRWFVDGPYQQQARSVRHADDNLTAPALLTSGTPHLLPIPPLLPRALALAMELDHPVSDCIYLALAQEHRAYVVTADRRFAHRGAGHGVVLVEDLGHP